MKQVRPVSICTFPERLDGARRKAFYREIECCINVDRPAVVLDCSMLQVMNRAAIETLLCCLEEAMKRNGDVRIAALRAEPSAVVHSIGLDSLFQIFGTIREAVESFHRPNSFAHREQFKATGRRPEINAA